ncbi:MAG: hypothetical protein VKJ06_09575 [Vampirovibrionales bacterium]|nr:hypothetical protein [Vampirovibrionales bacterium]
MIPTKRSGSLIHRLSGHFCRFVLSALGVHQADWLPAWLQNAGQCSHVNLPMAEGKLVCPDCGVGFLAQWVRLRCVQCNRIVPSQYAFGKALRQVKALHPCCKHCGEVATLQETLDNPDVFQMQDALLVLVPLARPRG